MSLAPAMIDPFRSAPSRGANGTEIEERSSRPASARSHSLPVTRMRRTACRSAQLAGDESVREALSDDSFCPLPCVTFLLSCVGFRLSCLLEFSEAV